MTDPPALGPLGAWGRVLLIGTVLALASCQTSGAVAPDGAGGTQAAADDVGGGEVIRPALSGERVLLVGDSLMVGVGPSLTRLLADQGVETHFVGSEGTGLLTGGTDWLDGMAVEMADFDPAVVVIEACCNFAPTAALPEDSDAMYDAWRAAAEAAVDLASSRGAAVYWVVTPSPAPDSAYAWVSDRIERFNDIYRSLGVPLIDWAALLEPDGEFTADLTIGSSTLHVRAGDGLHFSPDGNDFVAAATQAAIAGSLA